MPPPLASAAKLDGSGGGGMRVKPRSPRGRSGILLRRVSPPPCGGVSGDAGSVALAELHLTSLEDLSILRTVFATEGKYLFFSIDEQRWLINTALGAPRFFRDRFAKALRKPGRGNWKAMEENAALMTAAQKEIERLKKRWMAYV